MKNKSNNILKFVAFSTALCAIPFASDTFQKKVYATVPRTMKPLFEHRKPSRLKDPGELVANLDLQRNDLLMFQLKQQFSAPEVDYILTHGQETDWNTCLNSMSKRIQLAEIIKLYHAFQIGDLREGESKFRILLIPKKDNQTIAEEMRPKEDMIFIINANGAEILTR